MVSGVSHVSRGFLSHANLGNLWNLFKKIHVIHVIRGFLGGHAACVFSLTQISRISRRALASLVQPFGTSRGVTKWRMGLHVSRVSHGGFGYTNFLSHANLEDLWNLFKKIHVIHVIRGEWFPAYLMYLGDFCLMRIWGIYRICLKRYMWYMWYVDF